MELPFLDKVWCCCIRFQQVSMTNTFFLKATTKNTHIVLHDKHEASHHKEKSYTLQTHINTDLEDHRTLLHRTKLTYMHTHTHIQLFAKHLTKITTKQRNKYSCKILLHLPVVRLLHSTGCIYHLCGPGLIVQCI